MSLLCLALTLTLGVPAHTEQILVDPARSTSAWGADFGWEFPGAGGEVAVTKDADRGPSLEGRFVFADQSRYAGAKWFGAIPRAKAIGFSVKLADRDGGMLRLRDATEQEHLGGFTAKRGEWVDIEVPLTPESFGNHWGGANDGQFHFPLQAVLIAVGRGPDQGSLRVSNLYVVADQPQPTERWKVTVEPGVPCGVALPKEKCEYQVHVLNCLKQRAEGDLQVEIEQPGAQPRIALSRHLAAGEWEQVDLPLRLPTDEIGYSCLRARFADAQAGALPTVASGLVVVPRPRHYGESAPDCYFGLQSCPDLEAAERLGAKAIREAPGWRWAEPSPGDIRWSEYLDPVIERDFLHHMEVLLTLQAIAPDWAAWKVPDRPLLRDLPAPDMLPAWSRFVAQCAARYRGKLAAIEIQNEPDLTCAYQPGLPLEEGADYYAKLLAAGAAGIKEGNPGLHIAGLDVSGGDFDGGLPFTKAVLDRAADQFDLYTAHPYASPRYFGPDQQPKWPGANQMAEKCQAAISLLSQHGKLPRMWIGELGWGLATGADPLSEYSTDFAACMTQALIVGKSVPGVQKFLWFTMAGCNESGYEYGLLRGTPVYPLPAALAYATCAQILDATRPVETKQVTGEIWRASFTCAERDELIVAWWSDGATAYVRAAAPKPAAGIVQGGESTFVRGAREAPSHWLDSYNRPLVVGKLGVPVGPLPVYWILPLKKVGLKPKLLETIEVTAPTPVAVDHLFIPAVDRVGLILSNKTNRALRASIDLGGKPTPVELPAGVKLLRQEAPLPQRLTVGQRQDVKVVITAGGERETLTQQVLLDPLSPPPAGFQADGDLGEWSSAKAFDLRERTNILPPDPGIGWDGPQDLSLRAYLAADARGLYFAAAVTDDVHAALAQDADNFWESDSIQLAVDPSDDSFAGLDADDREVGFVLGQAGPRAFLSYPSPRKQIDVPFAIRRVGTQTIYEALLPWATLAIAPPAAGQVLALDFIANDNDGRGRAYWMGLTPGIGEGKTPSAYRKFAYGP